MLAFPGGALVHFAVSNTEAAMTTRLAGLDDELPAVQPGQQRWRWQPAKSGIATDYLWKEIWQRDS